MHARPGMLLAIGGGLLACVLLTRQTEYVGFFWDDGFYLAIADWLNPFSATPTWILEWGIRERGYPIFYPLLLALGGADLSHVGRAYFINGLIIFGAYAVTVLWFRERVDSRWVGLGLAAVVILSAGSLKLLNLLFAENLYLLVSIGAFVLWSRKGQSPGALLAAGLLCGAAAATRTIGIALVGAFMLQIVISRPVRGWWPVAAPVIPMAFNEWLRDRLDAPSYLVVWWDQGPGLEPAAWIEFLGDQAVALLQGWGGVFTGFGWSPHHLFLLPLLVLAGLGWGLMLRRYSFETVYLAGYLGIVMIWPFPEHFIRFIYPVLPVALWLAWEGWRWLRGQLFAESLAGRLDLGLVLVLLLVGPVPNLLHLGAKLSAPLPERLASLRRTPEWLETRDRQTGLQILEARRRWMDDARRIRDTVPQGECVITELATLVWVQAVRATRLPDWYGVGEALETPLRTDCNYYYLVPVMLSGESTPAQIDAFVARHDLLHVTPSPRDPSGVEKLGILLRLRRPQE